MIVRLLLVVVVVGSILFAVRLSGRYRGFRRRSVPSGLTLVTTEGCAECARAESALEEAGAVYTKVLPSDPVARTVKVLSAPVAVVGDANGKSVMIRRGRAVAADAERLANVSD